VPRTGWAAEFIRKMPKGRPVKVPERSDRSHNVLNSTAKRLGIEIVVRRFPSGLYAERPKV